MKRIIATLTFTSTIVCCLTLILFAVSYNLTLVNDELAPRHSVAMTSQCRCGIYYGSVWLFSHDYPSTGNMRFFGDDDGGIFYSGGHARLNLDWSWTAGGCGVTRVNYIGDVVGGDIYGDFPGIYYRHFAGMNEKLPIWTFRVSLWYPMLVSAICPALWMMRRGRSKLLLRQKAANPESNSSDLGQLDPQSLVRPSQISWLWVD